MSIKQIKDRVIGFIKTIPEDKRKHLAAGFAICAFVSLFFGYIVGVLAAVVAGAGKEAYDYITRKGTPEFADFVYTVIGAVCFVLLSALLSLIIHALIMGLLI